MVVQLNKIDQQEWYSEGRLCMPGMLLLILRTQQPEQCDGPDLSLFCCFSTTMFVVFM